LKLYPSNYVLPPLLYLISGVSLTGKSNLAGFVFQHLKAKEQIAMKDNKM